MSFALGTQPTTEVDGVSKCSFMLPARAFPRPHERASCLQRRCVMLIEAAFNESTGEIIAAAIEVHRALGPGLLESTYSECLQMEVKSVATILPVHHAQVLTYLRLTGCPAGLLINFHVVIRFLRTLRDLGISVR